MAVDSFSHSDLDIGSPTVFRWQMRIARRKPLIRRLRIGFGVVKGIIGGLIGYGLAAILGLWSVDWVLWVYFGYLVLFVALFFLRHFRPMVPFANLYTAMFLVGMFLFVVTIPNVAAGFENATSATFLDWVLFLADSALNSFADFLDLLFGVRLSPIKPIDWYSRLIVFGYRIAIIGSILKIGYRLWFTLRREHVGTAKDLYDALIILPSPRDYSVKITGVLADHELASKTGDRILEKLNPSWRAVAYYLPEPKTE